MKKLEIVLDVKSLKKYFYMKRNSVLKAVDDVSFQVARGETLGLVGESGCGKTTCGRTCAGLYPKTGGTVLFKGCDVHGLVGKDKKNFTKAIQTIFQDPYSSLDPRMRIADIVAEGIDAHNLAADIRERRDKIDALLNLVGLNSDHASRYVHEFSGGQRQRIGIARALAVDPEFVICDEPVSALDVSTQAQVINLLIQIQEKRNLGYLFIAHDLSIVRHISDRVAVMYLGVIVELSGSAELYKNPAHPYTKALLSSIPIPDPRISNAQTRIKLEGEIPSPINPENGCRFKNRCRHAKKVCGEISPVLLEISSGHYAACHLYA